MKLNLPKSIALASLLLAGAVEAQESFNVNLYSIGKPGAPSVWVDGDPTANIATLTLEGGESAGFWATTVWQNINLGNPFGANAFGPVTINGTEGSTATFKILDRRNSGPWNWNGVRDDSDAVSVGDATLFDGHTNGTEVDGGGSNPWPTAITDFEVSAIPFALYDVIVYIGANSGQYAGGGAPAGAANIRVTGQFPADPLDPATKDVGTLHFTLLAGEPTGTLDEVTAEGDTGNYVVFSALAAPTFRAQVWGSGFNHIGVCGFQIRKNTTVVGAVDAAVSTVMASPASIPADGTTSSTITVALKDSGGIPVSGKNVTLAGDTGKATITPSTPQPSGADGKATFTVSSSTAGIEVFTATDVSDGITLTQTASVNFLAAGPVDAGNSTLTAAPTGVHADGTSTSAVTVTLKDSIGLLIRGEGVTLSGSTGNPVITPAGAQTTDANGRATFTVKSSVAEVVTFTATSVTDAVVIAQTASVNFVDPNAPIMIHVNFYASSGGLETQVPQDPATLQGPAGGLGESWNQFNTATGANLLASSGLVTGVGYTNNVSSGWYSGSFPLTMLSASRAIFGKGEDTNHKITGLPPGSFFHVWIASYNHNTTLNERALGAWSTTNPTTTGGPQIIDSSTSGLNNSTWQQGVNYVRFEYVEVDSNGEITLLGDAAEAGEYGSPDACRLHLNGFQLVQTSAPLARISSLGIPGSAGVIDEEAKTITLKVPYGTDLATLAPEFTLTSGTCNQTSGLPPSPSFAAAHPAHYVVTDTATDPDTVNHYTVTLIGGLVIDLGTGTVIRGGTFGTYGATNLPLPAFPAGSILRSIAVNTKIEATNNENYASDLALLLDPTPAVPGGDFSVGITNGELKFGATVQLGWPLAAGGPPPTPLVDTKTAADWSAAGNIDLHTNGLFLGNAYDSGTPDAGGTWSGTITLTYDMAVVGSPYGTWSGGQPFDGDQNGDGVDNGLAFLLGAANPGENARGRLPAASDNGSGGLVLDFSMLNAANRGAAKLSVQWSNDLGVADPWSGNVALVPDADGTVNGVVFDITEGNPLNGVKATIPSSEASGGKLFGRLSGSEN